MSTIVVRGARVDDVPFVRRIHEEAFMILALDPAAREAATVVARYRRELDSAG
jgi:hypothetical protein